MIAFEPQPELVEHLRSLRERFRLRRLEIVNMGLSSQTGELTLRRPRTHWGGASFEPQYEARRDTESIRSSVTTLDYFFEDHPHRPVRFIKCDVECHEYHVFRGGRQVLLEDRPELLFECHDGSNPDCAVFSYLKDLDYEGYCFFEKGLAPVSDYASLRPRMHKKALVDFVFLPKESIDRRTRAA